MEIPTVSYESIAHDYRAAIEWMNDLGVKINSGRTTHYSKVVEYWKDTYKYASEAEAKDAFPDFVSSMFEISDFIDIYNAFKDAPIEKLEGIKDKLIKGVKGPVSSSRETPASTTARNFVFEALTAARLHNPHKGVAAILEAESDTGISISNKKLWVECKRVSSITKLESNVRAASSQLERILNKKLGSCNRGVVAVDVTKILNPKDKLYIQHNDQLLFASVDYMMRHFIDEHSNQWGKVYARRSKKVIGTIIRFSFMAKSESRNILVRTSQWAVNPRINIQQSDSVLLESLVSAIG